MREDNQVILPAIAEATRDAALAEVARRARAGGAFAARAEASEASVEATAWAAIGFAFGGAPQASAQLAAGAALVQAQAADGRLSASPLHPGAYAPTSLALLAWNRAAPYAAARSAALAFLVGHAGERFARSADSALEIDPELSGWPWIDKTFSWCEPTALALLALEVEQRGDDSRATEGRRLLLDRQLPSGGWNYGNTRVFGNELRPAPEATGLVLAALAGRLERSTVAASLDYLARQAPRLPTPLALGWTLLALASWGERPPASDTWLAQTLARAERYGGYETAELALLAIAASAPAGILDGLAARAAAPRPAPEEGAR